MKITLANKSEELKKLGRGIWWNDLLRYLDSAIWDAFYSRNYKSEQMIWLTDSRVVWKFVAAGEINLTLDLEIPRLTATVGYAGVTTFHELPLPGFTSQGNGLTNGGYVALVEAVKEILP